MYQIICVHDACLLHAMTQSMTFMHINCHVCAGKPHQFWNGDNTTVLDMEFTLTPAGTFEQFIRTFCGLASDAGTVDNVSPLQMLVLFPHGDMQLADMPKPVWLFVERIVVPVLQSLHIYKPVYPEYAGDTYT